MKETMRVTAVFAVLTSLLAGCNGGSQGNAAGGQEQGQGQTQSNVSSGAITLSVFQSGASISDEEFKELLVDPVKKVYPNINLQLVRSSNAKMEDLITAGNFPDLMLASSRDLYQFIRINLPLDLGDLVKKNNMNMSKFDPTGMEAIKNYADKGQLFAIPLFINFSALYYNKDIFDKFGVPYPKDSMTWEDAIDLGKNLSRLDNGVQYRGLDSDSIRNFSSGLSIPAIDPKTQKASMMTESWKNVINMYTAIKTLPGNGSGNPNNLFLKDRILAMLPAYGARLGELEELHNQGNAVNYDLATYPAFKEAPGLTAEIDVHLLMISSLSKNQEQAFQVISVVTGDENQMKSTRRGRFSALSDPKMKQEFGADLKSLKGKNVQGLFKSKPSVGARRTLYDSDAWKLLSTTATDAYSGKVDTNTALRQADEAINMFIAGQKAK